MTEPTSPETIFSAALERDPAGDRAAYLDEACGDDRGLRRRVERLLAAHLRADGFLERPIVAAGSAFLGSSSGRDGAEGHDAPPAGGPSLDFLAPSTRPDALGRLGPFEVLEVVGAGGMGLVLRAFDPKLHRAVAIKTLAPILAAIGPARRRFVREARSTASVIHENVIAIYAVEDDGPAPFLVMPFIEGPTLQERLDRKGPLPLEEILRIGMQVAAGLAAAHAQGLVHRDVKPSNILLENGVERVKITDFGLARVVDDPGPSMPGFIAGTPAYMSPEQAAGKPVDHRSDLFSLGSVLYALCTGAPPFRGETILAVIRQVSDDRPRPVRRLNPGVPPWLQALIGRLHAQDPAKRPRTAAEVAELLGRRLAELQEAGGDAGTVAPTRSRWRRPIAAIALAALGLAGAEATGITSFRGITIRPSFSDGAPVAEGDDPAIGATIGEPGSPPGDEESWERSVAGLPAEEKLIAVIRRLREKNPDFDGRARSEMRDGEVRFLELPSDTVADISPVRALRALDRFVCRGVGTDKRGRLTDLSPLRGIPLSELTVAYTEVSDMGPFEKARLTTLDLQGTLVTDLSPLKGSARLDSLQLQLTEVSDLAPIRGLPIRWLDLHGARRITDLRMLEGMPLEYLNLTDVEVADFSVLSGLKSLQILIWDGQPDVDLSLLRGLKLRELALTGSTVRDLGLLRDLPLRKLRLDYRPEYEPILRSLAKLDAINSKPVDQFWESVGVK